MTVRIPHGADPEKIARLSAQEHEQAKELQLQGKWLHRWRVAGKLVPCQITVGRHDPFVPVSNADGFRKGLPKSKLDVLDCGHFAWEDAAEYGVLASAWLQGGYTKLEA